MSIVPLFNGERSDSLNLWGGPFSRATRASFTKQSTVVHSGTGAYQANLGSIANGGFQVLSDVFERGQRHAQLSAGSRSDPVSDRSTATSATTRRRRSHFHSNSKTIATRRSHVAKRSYHDSGWRNVDADRSAARFEFGLDRDRQPRSDADVCRELSGGRRFRRG